MQGIALIGCGWFGTMIAKAVSNEADLELLHLVDSVEGRAAALRRRFARNAKASADPREALDDPRVSAVAIATLPALHETLALEALSAGKRVFCEKPGALTSAGAERVANQAEALGIPAAVDLVMRHNPLYRALRRFVEIAGPVERLALENFAHDERLPPSHWFWDKKLSGGIFVEHGIHFFDLANYLLQCDAPRWLWARGFRRDGDAEGNLEDRVAALGLYPSGSVASFYHSFRRPETLERTTLITATPSAFATVKGWIPVQLEIEAPGGGPTREALDGAAEAAQEALPDLQPPSCPAVSLRFAPNGARGAAYELLPDRWEVYLGCIRAGLKDLMRTTASSQPLASYRQAQKALAVAERAERAAGTVMESG